MGQGMAQTASDGNLDPRDPDDGPERPAFWRWLIPAAAALLLIGLAYWAVTSLGGPSAPKRQTVKIAVLPDTPPPPPPPPKEEKKPEPEKQDLKPQPQQEQPKPVEAPPEPQQLKMEGPAGDGPSAFAAGSVATEYKGGEIGTGTGGINRLQFAAFTNQLTRDIQAQLLRHRDLRGLDYRVSVNVWLAPSGDLSRVELASSTGNEATDAVLRRVLNEVNARGQVPPDLPQPLTLRITNRVTG